MSGSLGVMTRNISVRGSASDGPAHVEVFALQRRAVSTACSGSQCQGDRWC